MTDTVTRHMANELRNLARLAAQWADVLDAESASLQEHGPEVARESGAAEAAAYGQGEGPNGPGSPAAVNRPPPVIFSCVSCGARTVWNVPGYDKPWPNAMCSSCYAEHRMRRDEIQDVVVGYTGVR